MATLWPRKLCFSSLGSGEENWTHRASACLKQKGDLGGGTQSTTVTTQQEVQAPLPQPRTSNTTSAMTYILLRRFALAQTDATAVTRDAL